MAVGDGRPLAVDLAASGGEGKHGMSAVLASLALSLRQLADLAIWRVLIKSVAVSLGLFAVLGTATWLLIEAALEWSGFTDALLGQGSGSVLRGAAAAVLTALGLWLTWRIIALAVLNFFADEVVEAVERRHYPQAAHSARKLSLGEQAGGGLRSAARAIAVNLLVLPVALALLLTGFGPALLLFVANAWLIGLELMDMVWLRHRRAGTDKPPVSAAERFVLGASVAALLLVPFVAFLAPVLGAAAAAHLLHRRGVRP